MKGNDVKRLYKTGAIWYDAFKPAWNRLVASKAERDLSLFLLNNLNENKSILELGCGTAANLEKIYSLKLKFRSYLGLDFSEQMLRVARDKFKNKPNVEFREKDITALDDIKDKFDIILCTWVLSHMEARSTFVNRAQGLMKQESKFFVICFTEPKRLMKLWLNPAMALFSVNPVKNDEVLQFQNVNAKRSYSNNITTVIEIHR